MQTSGQHFYLGWCSYSLSDALFDFQRTVIWVKFLSAWGRDKAKCYFALYLSCYCRLRSKGCSSRRPSRLHSTVIGSRLCRGTLCWVQCKWNIPLNRCTGDAWSLCVWDLKGSSLIVANRGHLNQQAQIITTTSIYILNMQIWI